MPVLIRRLEQRGASFGCRSASIEIANANSAALTVRFRPQALLGRDVLARCRLAYDGPRKRFRLAW